MKDPAKYEALGATVPKGVLLEGPPGTGKTLLARALAGEANCTFISTSGSEFIQTFVGAGAGRVRSLFSTAWWHGPCIIFIDEIDALIRKRGDAVMGHDEHGQTLNELLAQMDGFEKPKYPVIVIGATNRVDTADPAALRPGRFDRIVRVGLPTVQDREKILALHASYKKCAADIDLTIIAQKTPGFSGAQLANLINEAAIMAINAGKKEITQAELEAACDKLIMGTAKIGAVVSEEEKILTAYHEVGHALVHILLNPKHSTLHKVSIIARGNSEGHTAFLPVEKTAYTKEDFLNAITVALGSRAAEALIYNTVMTGPAADLQHATDVAREMVCLYGMSSLGAVAYTYMHSPFTQTDIDKEIHTIIESCYQKAFTLLSENKDKLDIIAHALVEKEELSAQEIFDLIKA